MRKFFIIALLFISFLAKADIKNAVIYFNSGKYINAIDEYRKILLQKADDATLNQAILGLGNCYHELGVDDKAVFYYSKYLENINNDAIRQRLIDILISRQDFDGAVVYADEIKDDITRLKKMIDIYTAKDDKSELSKTLVAYYDRTNDIMILAKLIRDFPERAVKWDNTFEYRFIQLMIKNDLKEANNLIDEIIRKDDSFKISSLLRFLEDNNKKLAIRLAEYLYRKNRSGFDFNRLARLYFDTGRIERLNELIDEQRKRLGDKRFIESTAGILLNFGMYEKFIDIIKSDKEYYKDRDLRRRLLEVLKSGMSFSKFFDELIFLNKMNIMNITALEREIKSVLKTSHRWPEAYLNHKISDILPDDLKLISYYLTGDIKEAKAIFVSSKPSIRSFFLRDTAAYMDFAEYIDEKDDFEVFSKACDFFSSQKLKEFIDVKTPLRYFLKSLETLLKRGDISVDRITTLTEKHDRLKELRKRLIDEISGIGIKPGKDAIKTGDGILLELSDLYLLYRIYNISRKIEPDQYLSQLCRSVVSISTYIYFEKKDYKKVMYLYNTAAIKRDELFFVCAVLDGIDIENYIKGMTDWRLLDIYETSLAIKDKKELEKVLRGKI